MGFTAKFITARPYVLPSVLPNMARTMMNDIIPNITASLTKICDDYAEMVRAHMGTHDPSSGGPWGIWQDLSKAWLAKKAQAEMAGLVASSSMNFWAFEGFTKDAVHSYPVQSSANRVVCSAGIDDSNKSVSSTGMTDSEIPLEKAIKNEFGNTYFHDGHSYDVPARPLFFPVAIRYSVPASKIAAEKAITEASTEAGFGPCPVMWHSWIDISMNTSGVPF